MYEKLIIFLVIAAFLYILAVALQTSMVFAPNEPDTVLTLSKTSSVLLILSAVSLLVGVIFAVRHSRY